MWQKLPFLVNSAVKQVRKPRPLSFSTSGTQTASCSAQDGGYKNTGPEGTSGGQPWRSDYREVGLSRASKQRPQPFRYRRVHQRGARARDHGTSRRPRSCGIVAARCFDFGQKAQTIRALGSLTETHCALPCALAGGAFGRGRCIQGVEKWPRKSESMASGELGAA